MSKSTRVRKPSVHGTCQACGDVVTLAASREPHIVLKHGYLVIEGSVRVACAGSGYPPIEVSRERGEALVALYRQQLADLRTHGRDMSERVVPAGLSGAAALRARFAAGQSGAPPVPQPDASLPIKIREIEKLLRTVQDTLATGSSKEPLRRKASPTHRINAMFRRSKDSMVYIVEGIEPPSRQQTAINRRLAPTYMCRNVETGKRIRVTQNELTRALNEQIGMVPLSRGTPVEIENESSAA
jgi:hypothetical protein